ncbi:MAG: sulfurtransferase TusA family protein [Syntrophobacteraceae bacterium]
MESDKTLDLRGIITPYCLLQCKSVLAGMNPGAILAVRIHDPETVSDLLKILERSGETVVSTRRIGEEFLIRVRRHRQAGSQPPTEKDY